MVSIKQRKHFGTKFFILGLLRILPSQIKYRNELTFLHPSSREYRLLQFGQADLSVFEKMQFEQIAYNDTTTES